MNLDIIIPFLAAKNSNNMTYCTFVKEFTLTTSIIERFECYKEKLMLVTLQISPEFSAGNTKLLS